MPDPMCHPSRPDLRGTLTGPVLAVALGLALSGCRTRPPKPEHDVVVRTSVPETAPELSANADVREIRSLERNVDQYFDLLDQGRNQQAEALRMTIADSVDRQFDSIARIARHGEMQLERNPAVKCLAFARERRVDARDVLMEIVSSPSSETITIVSNAVLALGILSDPDTDLAPIIRLVGSGNLEVRTNAATALKDLFRVRTTPRELTPEYYTAIDRLVALMHDPASSRARRAAVFALANLHHPEVLPNLVAALEDEDKQVQLGGLYGIEMLGDQRAIEPLLAYLEKEPSEELASWAVLGLRKIALQGGFAQDARELDSLGTNPVRWSDWFRAARAR